MKFQNIKYYFLRNKVSIFPQSYQQNAFVTLLNGHLMEIFLKVIVNSNNLNSHLVFSCRCEFCKFGHLDEEVEASYITSNVILTDYVELNWLPWNWVQQNMKVQTNLWILYVDSQSPDWRLRWLWWWWHRWNRIWRWGWQRRLQELGGVREPSLTLK